MKIALELQTCSSQMSGIGHYTFQLAKRICQMENAEVRGRYFNFCMRNPKLSQIGFAGQVDYNTLLPYGAYCRFWDIVPVPYRAMFPSADISHFFNFIIPPGVSGKVIDTIYDLTYLRYPETMISSNLSRLKNGIQRSLDRSNVIITDSEFIKGEIVHVLGVNASRIEVIYPAATEEETEQLSDSYLAEHWGICKPYILYLGTIEPRKNLNRLIQAYEKACRELLEPPILVLAGGTGWKSEDTRRLAAETLPGQIVMTGYISGSEKRLLYQNASLFVFPSIYEGFGIPVLEAMKYGIPVVCSNTSSLPEVAGDGACFVDPLDVNGIAGGMLELLTDSDRAAALARAGKISAERFSWDKSAEKLMQIYRKLGE